ncbi:hypothetical protein [Ralstonia solanacearum]|uniref:hypothetical protein n=2 Tax=Ralstonia solanacearum TaxID=305 RepID=UPI00202A9D71|nr:hypothetical protein [Ralstonia solanacearum]MCL9846055.1 hypothetical protein [Ralstonia solanacearum]MDC6253893.1 hypothetical protein [Ralstonia solanacearum]MDC6258604.1 hypothetical protein [Ralstonia solanacearum]MDC6303375.1 hypothetical protein [Ralstonia solanacearum]
MPNPDWQKEYARWYGKPPKGTKHGVHWARSLMVWVAALLVVYIAAKQLRLTGNGAALSDQQAASTQSAPTTAPPLRQPAPTAQQPTAQTVAPLGGVNKCVINGQTVYTEAPCAQAMRALVGNAPAQAPGNARQREMEEAAVSARRAEEQLARQWDQRMAQRDRDLAAEQIAVQQQVSATGAECARLKADRDSILRLSVTTQQQSPWRDNLNYIRKRMNELHC